MNKENLLFICGNVSPNSSQGVRYLNLISQLKSDFKITVISYTALLKNSDIDEVTININNEEGLFASEFPQINIYSLIKIAYRRFIRPHIFPDKYKFKLRKYRIKIDELLINKEIKKVIIGMTPFSLYELASYIKSKDQSIEVICDLSDPFSFNGSDDYSFIYSRNRIRKYEINRLKSVDKIVVLNPSIRDLYVKKLNFKRTYVIEQGLNESKCIAASDNKSQLIKLIYAGGLYKGFREATELYSAISRFQDKVSLEIYGNINEELLPNPRYKWIKYFGIIANNLLNEKYINSDCIIFIDNNVGFQVPGKVLEIQEFGIPILFIYSNPQSPSLQYLFNNNIIKVLNNSFDIQKGIEQLLVKRNIVEKSPHLEKYYWNNLVETYKNILND